MLPTKSVTSLGKAWKLITANRVNLILSIIPILLGIVLYAFLGVNFYSSAAGYGDQIITQYISEGTFGSVIGFILKALITVMLFFFVNWTFVMVVTIFAGPFNDVLSSRIEKQIKNQELFDLSQSLKLITGNFFSSLFNEFKKISLILFLGILSFILGYIPFLTPLSILLAVLLLSIGFLDYSWSRHNVSFGSCVNDIRKNLIKYSIGGGIFFLLVSVPVLNLIVPPLATSYFTLLWVNNHELSN